MGKGKRPEKCPKCGNIRIEEQGWICPLCLEATKNEAIKLMDFLLEDFGISKDKIKTHFSGSRGYHLTAEGSDLEELDQLSRNEISDYVSGVGLTLESLGISKGAPYDDMRRSLPLLDELGWRGRIAKSFVKSELEGYNDVSKDVRDRILYIYGKKGYKGFEGFIKEIINDLSVKIDTMVTTDLHRIFRLSNTLHGSTGMLKKECSDIISFDPSTDAVVLGEEPVKIFINNAPKFALRGYSFGPYNSEKVTLPLMASVYLMGKGLAKVVDNE
jgi:DNA primase small subunit